MDADAHCFALSLYRTKLPARGTVACCRNLLCLDYDKMALKDSHTSGGSSESDLPDSDSVFGINSGADTYAGIDSD